MKHPKSWKTLLFWVIKLSAAGMILYLSVYLGIFLIFTLSYQGFHPILIVISCLLLPGLIPLLFLRKKIVYGCIYGIVALIFLIICAIVLIFNDPPAEPIIHTLIDKFRIFEYTLHNTYKEVMI